MAPAGSERPARSVVAAAATLRAWSAAGHGVLEFGERARQPRRQTVRQQAERGVGSRDSTSARSACRAAQANSRRPGGSGQRARVA